MATAIVDLFDLLEGFSAGAWAAISERQHSVPVYDADAQTVLCEAQSKGEDQPLIVRVPKQASAMFF